MQTTVKPVEEEKRKTEENAGWVTINNIDFQIWTCDQKEKGERRTVIV